MSRTTITLHDDTKALLDRRKTEGESYDAALRRLCNEEGILWTENEIRTLVRETVRVELEARR